MNRSDILVKVQEIFREELDHNSLVLSEESSANTVSGWDSLIHVQIISAIEDEFDITFSSKEIISWKNVGEMIDSIQKHL